VEKEVKGGPAVDRELFQRHFTGLAVENTFDSNLRRTTLETKNGAAGASGNWVWLRLYWAYQYDTLGQVLLDGRIFGVSVNRFGQG